MIERVLEMAAAEGGGGSITPPVQAPAPAPAPEPPVAAAAPMSMNEVMEAMKQAVASGGADPKENLRLQFVMQKARDGGVADAMLDRVLGMVAASASPAPAPLGGGLGSAPVARAAAVYDDDDDEPELTEEDLAARRQDVLDSIVESVQRSGSDLSENLKLGFLLKSARQQNVSESEIEEAIGGPTPPVASSVSNGGGGAPSATVTVVESVASVAPPLPVVSSMRATDVVVEALIPQAAQEDLVQMTVYQRNTYARNVALTSLCF